MTMQSHTRLLAKAEEKAIEDTFWSSYVPIADQGFQAKSLDTRRPQASYQLLQEIMANSPLIERCTRACAFACVGRENSDRRLNMRGAQIYSTVLRQASALVAHAAVAPIDDLLACCIAMCNYEALRDDTEPGEWYFPRWHDHVKGLCQVLRTRGLSDESSASIRYAWQEARIKSARSAMFLRQPVFMLEGPSRSQAKADEGLRLFDDMLDACFAVSQWFPQVDGLMRRVDSESASLPRAAKRAVQRGMEIAQKLVEWEKRAETLYCDESRPSLYSLCTSATPELFNTLLHYWMVRMLLESQLRVLVARFSLLHLDLVPELPSWIDGAPYAAGIQRAGPLACDPSLGVWSAQQAITPMIAAIFYFAGTGNWHTPEARSLRAFVEDYRPGNALLRRWFRGMFAGKTRQSISNELIPQAEMVAIAQRWYGLSSA